VSAYAQGDPEKSRVIEERSVEAHYPDYVDFSFRASGVRAREAYLVIYDNDGYELADIPVTDALKTTSNSVSISYRLSIQEYYLPPDTELSYEWYLDGDEEAWITPSQTFKLIDERFEWQSLTDDEAKISVHWHSDSSDMGTEVKAAAARAKDRLEDLLATTFDKRIKIWVYETDIELYRLFPNGITEWTGGFALSEWELILIVIPSGSGQYNVISAGVPHEVSHLVFDHITGYPDNTPPTWLNEGLAGYMEETQDEFLNARTLVEAAHQGQILGMDEFDEAFERTDGAITANLAYEQSKSIVKFIIEDPKFGARKLKTTLRAFEDTDTTDEALFKGLGVDSRELERQWRESLPFELPDRKQGEGKPAATSEVASGFLSALPAIFCLGMPVLILLLWLSTFVRQQRMRKLDVE
jgi:hypothetical protein